MNELEAMGQGRELSCGYQTLINWDKAGAGKSYAPIQVRVDAMSCLFFVFC